MQFIFSLHQHYLQRKRNTDEPILNNFIPDIYIEIPITDQEEAKIEKKKEKEKKESEKKKRKLRMKIFSKKQRNSPTIERMSEEKEEEIQVVSINKKP